MAKEARVPLHGAEFSGENGVFVQRRGKEVTERGLSLPKPKSKEGQTETSEAGETSQWHQEVGRLCLVFSPVLGFGL